ncbi:hypothetical protein [uncultured Pelagimonas sp.]|uniref:hypothetical protein n=1 Tax=uncultured Pelagimonas sp. TaxID=1618102 RepID=UPI00261A4CEA|nr:hypothetical protein [uncultured Pelagimonas sp.]
MTRFATPLLIASLAAAPLAAQEEEGPSLIEQGAQLFFKGLMEEMEPALEELEGMAQEMEPFLKKFSAEMGPALKELMGEVDDWSAYHPPEKLPNGDIIMRRKSAEEMDDSARKEPEEVEL